MKARTSNTMRRIGIAILWLALCPVMSAGAQVSVGIGIGLPGVNIGINFPSYPQLVRVPGYPVYYAPHLKSNYFFYDGMYWVYQGDHWYASSWYNGPWGIVAPEVVPAYMLRVPVRYYRQPPVYFHGWRRDAAPRWGEHWGREWEQHRGGWDRGSHGSVPPPAPLPAYQRQYSGNRYPQLEQQGALRSRNYRYQPRDNVVREHYRQQGSQRPPSPAGQGGPPGATKKHSPPPAHGSKHEAGRDKSDGPGPDRK